MYALFNAQATCHEVSGKAVCDICSDPTHMDNLCQCLNIAKYVNPRGLCSTCPISCFVCVNDDVDNVMCETCSDRLNMKHLIDYCECINTELYINKSGKCTECNKNATNVMEMQRVMKYVNLAMVLIIYRVESVSNATLYA